MDVLPGVRKLIVALDGRPGVRVGLLTGNIEEGARLKLTPTGRLPYSSPTCRMSRRG